MRNIGSNGVEEDHLIQSTVRRFAEIKFIKTLKTRKNGPLEATKSPQKSISPIHIDSSFLQQTVSKLVKFGLGSSISDLHRHIGGPHLVRFPDPPYGVGRGNEPLRSWEFYFGVKELKHFQGSSLKIGAFWNSAHVRTILTLASPSHIHWLPGGKQFYPASSLPLR